MAWGRRDDRGGDRDDNRRGGGDRRDQRREGTVEPNGRCPDCDQDVLFVRVKGERDEVPLWNVETDAFIKGPDGEYEVVKALRLHKCRTGGRGSGGGGGGRGGYSQAYGGNSGRGGYGNRGGGGYGRQDDRGGNDRGGFRR